MNIFIILTALISPGVTDTIYVNCNHISAVYSKEGFTRVKVIDSKPFAVEESVEDIARTCGRRIDNYGG